MDLIFKSNVKAMERIELERRFWEMEKVRAKYDEERAKMLYYEERMEFLTAQYTKVWGVEHVAKSQKLRAKMRRQSRIMEALERQMKYCYETQQGLADRMAKGK